MLNDRRRHKEKYETSKVLSGELQIILYLSRILLDLGRVGECWEEWMNDSSNTVMDSDNSDASPVPLSKWISSECEKLAGGEKKRRDEEEEASRLDEVIRDRRVLFEFLEDSLIIVIYTTFSQVL